MEWVQCIIILTVGILLSYEVYEKYANGMDCQTITNLCLLGVLRRIFLVISHNNKQVPSDFTKFMIDGLVLF